MAMSDRDRGAAYLAAGRQNSEGTSFFEAWLNGIMLKRLILALAALGLVVFIAVSLVPPATWTRLKWQIFGKPQQQSQPQGTQGTP